MAELHRVGVISDTHVPARAARVPEAALRAFEAAGVELILHAGDLSSLAVLDQLAAYAPVEAVQGNVELAEVVARLPPTRELLIGGCAIGLVHDLGERRRYAQTARRLFPDARVVVFGHSHVPMVEDANGLLLLNPGSATDRRGQPRCTVALLTITDGEPAARLVALA
jgi:putative phosphoesterase